VAVPVVHQEVSAGGILGMPADRNKSLLTRKITSAAARYLDEQGVKPIETEVQVGDSWVADLAGIWCPTITELVKMKLIHRRPAWEKGQAVYREWWERAKKVQRRMIVLVEVKSAEGDFKSDGKWKQQIPADLGILAVPADWGIVDDEVPPAWGILKYYDQTGVLRLARVPEIQTVSVEQQLEVAVEIAVRRDHLTRHARLREFRRQLVVTQNENISRTRVLDAMRVMEAIVEARYGSVEETLERWNIKHLPKYYLPELRALWGCKKKEPSGRTNSN